MILNKHKKTGLRKLKLPKSMVLTIPFYAARETGAILCCFSLADHPIKSCKCVLAELSVEKYSLHSDKTNRIATFSFCIVINILATRVVYSIVDQVFRFFPRTHFFLPLKTIYPG